MFAIEANKLTVQKHREIRKTNWCVFRSHLEQSKRTGSKIRSPADLDNAANDLQKRIITAYNDSCSLVTRSLCRDVPWWNENLATLKKEARRLFTKANITGNWSNYRTALTKYNTELRKAKKLSMHEFCENIGNFPEAVRLQKALSKDHTNGLGQVKNGDGFLTIDNSEALDVLMNTHFPGSVAKDENSTGQDCDGIHPNRTCEASQKLASQIFTPSLIKWAINTFEPYKSPGPDNILPIFLQKSNSSY
ncbi:uncharacterized protein LOC131687303 [Topomyia yanbarensis]|uniref:uncharacterized protein LOC131687303 n=1 Tax=Topomyia yanbarensis TaxID=2498891 RepID=UPI00273B7D87|nr:uncharacterized protein LOC131687303 [Topomyia yanbarensis]